MQTMRGSVAAGCWSLAISVALVFLTAPPVLAQAQARPTVAMDGRWHFVVAPYVWFAGINGEVSVKGLPEVPIDESFSDIWKSFHFGFLAHFEGRKDRWGFATDILYMDLQSPVAAEAPVLGPLGIEAIVKSLTAEGIGFYRAASGGREDNPAQLDVLAGARYFSTSPRLSATVPIGGELAGEKQTFGFVDALIGLRFRTPLGSRVGLIGRGDIAAGGSKFAWNLAGDLAFALSEHWTLGTGWRHLSIDYDKGSGTDRKLFDAAYDGPRTWFSYAW